jgi:hypothetical protein
VDSPADKIIEQYKAAGLTEPRSSTSSQGVLKAREELENDRLMEMSPEGHKKRVREKIRKRHEEECLWVVHDHAGCYCGLIPIGKRGGRFQEYYRTECSGHPHAMCPHPEEYKPRGPIEEPENWED